MNQEEQTTNDEPCYVISIAARLVGAHQQTLRYYERAGLMQPSRSIGRRRLYSVSDIARLKEIQQLMNDLGVNLAGVDVIFRMRERMRELESELDATRRQLQRLRESTAASAEGSMIDDDRWPETESGTVVRHYFHTRGANREMQTAQKEGWNVQEVKINGAVATEQRKGLLRRSPLVRQRDGTLQIRGASAAGWGHPQKRGQEQIEVTYQR